MCVSCCKPPQLHLLAVGYFLIKKLDTISKGQVVKSQSVLLVDSLYGPLGSQICCALGKRVSKPVWDSQTTLIQKWTQVYAQLKLCFDTMSNP